MTPEIINHSFAGHQFHFYHTPTLPALIHEIFNDNYQILKKELRFGYGDIILDCGANEGLFSILMAKLFPQTTVISLEPVPRTFYQMIRNIGLNGVSNINPINLGVGAKREQKTLVVSKQFSGGSTEFCTFDPETHILSSVELYSLDDILAMLKIDQVKLLKCDTEGAEYDIFKDTTPLKRVEYVVCEIHINNRLEKEGCNMQDLARKISKNTNLLHVEFCRMAE